MIFTPEIEGDLGFKSPQAEFIAELHNRVASGLLTGKQPEPRSNYAVVESNTEFVRVRAADWLTAINVGMNDLDLQFSSNGSLHYRLRYWRWAIYSLSLCACLGLIGVAFFVMLDLPVYIANNADARIASLSVNQTLLFAWSNLIFWSVIWPWVLISLHKRPLRRLLARIVDEVDQQVTPAKQ
jgi:hypothetical protein